MYWHKIVKKIDLGAKHSLAGPKLSTISANYSCLKFCAGQWISSFSNVSLTKKVFLLLRRRAPGAELCVSILSMQNESYTQLDRKLFGFMQQQIILARISFGNFEK
jgi:hypothetical protein